MGGGQARELNRSYWDERVAIHATSEFYDVAGFRYRRDVLRDFEVAEVGDVTGRRLLHLQCHFGQDTLSWAHRGASVTGLDFSPRAVDTAR
nr:methyltransferase type 11 [Micromonospora sp. DSM 115978]